MITELCRIESRKSAAKVLRGLADRSASALTRSARRRGRWFGVRRGFTLVEVIVVLGVLAVVLGLSLPFILSTKFKTDINTTAEQLVTTLREAQNLAITGEGDTAYGVYFDITVSPQTYTLYRGASYTSRDTSYNVEGFGKTTLPVGTESAVSWTGSPEIAFARVTGKLINFFANWTPPQVPPSSPSDAFPTFGDLDNDGKTDLLFGAGDGNIYAYRNTGTVSSPVWSAAPASWTTGVADVGTDADPTLGDLDGDGDLDLLIGEQADDFINAYQNTGTATSPAWSAAPGSWVINLGAGSSYTPTLGDLDGDGDLDALVGSNNGVSYAYRNDCVSPCLSGPSWVANASWNTPDVGSDTTPVLVDLDDDGKMDVLIGEDAGVINSYRNTCVTCSLGPVWTLQSGWWDVNTDLGTDTVPAFADLNGDGDLDLFIGMSTGESFVYQNTGSAASPSWNQIVVTITVENVGSKPVTVTSEGVIY